jgi:PTS system galactitol-specific IIC component
MLITNTTQTVNVDIWNYWHFAFTGAMAQSLTGSFAIGVVVAALNMAIIMVIADRTGNGLEKYNGLPGISLPHGFTAAFVPIAAVFNKILDYIPGLKNVNVNMETIQKRMGVFGEPVLIGVVFGLIIGFLAKYEWKAVLQMAIQMGAALVLIPKMAALLMEGLIPISDAAQGFIEKRFKSRGKIFIGLDSAVGIGHPLCLTCALILVPLSIILAVILPGNRVLPFADLAVIPYIFVLIIPITKGDFIRSLIIGALTMIIMFYCGSDMVELLMATAAVADPATYANYGSNFSSICDGSNPLTWAMVKLANLQWIGVGIMAVITIALAVWNRKKIIAEAKTLAAEEAVEV